MVIQIRKGQAPAQLGREESSVRFRASFFDPVFRVDVSIARLEEIAWRAYVDSRKASFTHKAGPGYADPDYELSVDWIATKQRIDAAQLQWADPSRPSRVLLICGSARNDGTCPGEISKTFPLVGVAREMLEQADIEVDFLYLSLLTSEYGRNYGKTAQSKVKKSMEELKAGTLKSGSGKKVTNPKQAIAIGLSEARQSGAKVLRK